MTYPERTEVQNGSVEDLVRWNRFLASPRDDQQRDVMKTILERLRSARSEFPREVIAASKAVGW